jgi:hypothetical protein
VSKLPDQRTLPLETCPTTDVALLVATDEPDALLAVTATRRVAPASFEATVYV